MTELPFQNRSLDEAVDALERDLINEDGPRISTMRNYRFAILPYKPEEEFRLRFLINGLANRLRASGWEARSLSLQRLFLDRLRTMGEENLERLIQREKGIQRRSSDRALNYVRDKVAPQVEGPDGIAADVSREICAFADAHPEKAERAVFFIGRAGALYPFFRTSALLKHIDGRTRNIPVVLLYPGLRLGMTALSFMGELPADTDYRPRIYP